MQSIHYVWDIVVSNHFTYTTFINAHHFIESVLIISILQRKERTFGVNNQSMLHS